MSMKTELTPLLTHWSYCSLLLSHRHFLETWSIDILIGLYGARLWKGNPVSILWIFHWNCKEILWLNDTENLWKFNRNSTKIISTIQCIVLWKLYRRYMGAVSGGIPRNFNANYKEIPWKFYRNQQQFHYISMEIIGNFFDRIAEGIPRQIYRNSHEDWLYLGENYMAIYWMGRWTSMETEIKLACNVHLNFTRKWCLVIIYFNRISIEVA